MPTRPPFQIAGQTVASGTRRTVELPVAKLSDHTPVSMSVHVIHGRKPGPVLFVSAAVHGDEVIGVEIVRRLLRAAAMDRIAGTLIAVPIVNTFGFLNKSRYLPDRRDLNRSFPGTPEGSLAARLAHLFLSEIVYKADFGIDLHSAATARTNLPQIRISPGNARTAEMARVFGAPVVLTSPEREGSLRAAARARGVDMLLYEAGEGLRFDEFAARAGVSGILRIMRALEMVSAKGIAKPHAQPLICRKSSWCRAPASGLFRAFKSAGDIVSPGDVLGIVSDPFGEIESEVLAPNDAIIIGRATLPIVNEGDALFHLADLPPSETAEATMGALSDQLDADPLFDEDEII